MRKPITRKEWNLLVRYAKDCMRLASSHDPDHSEILKDHAKRLYEIERVLGIHKSKS